MAKKEQTHKKHSNKKPPRIHVQFKGGDRDGQVTKIEWNTAQDLITKGGAIAISRTLYRAAKAGVNIRSLKGEDRQNDALIKEKLYAQKKKDLDRQKKKKAARAKLNG